MECGGLPRQHNAPGGGGAPRGALDNTRSARLGHFVGLVLGPRLEREQPSRPFVQLFFVLAGLEVQWTDLIMVPARRPIRRPVTASATLMASWTARFVAARPLLFHLVRRGGEVLLGIGDVAADLYRSDRVGAA